jgi:hypothetical protein
MCIDVSSLTDFWIFMDTRCFSGLDFVFLDEDINAAFAEFAFD